MRDFFLSRAASSVVRPLERGPELSTAIAAVAAGREPVILESVAGGPHGRFSILACDPVEVLTVPAGASGDPLAPLAARVAAHPPVQIDATLPFAGGWIGFVSYEAGAALERITPSGPRATALPALRFSLYDTAAIHDRRSHRWWLAGVEWPPGHGDGRAPAADRLDSLERMLSSARPRQGGAAAASGTPVPDWTWAEYAERVAAARDYIAAGDVYQINLTQRFRARCTASPLDVYLALRHTNPADYAALLLYDEAAVISSSPELFLELQGGQVRTRPIKGTRPRTGDPVLDPIRRGELAASIKDQAELNMIVDLMRNDLGRVCALGSVRVESAGEIEEHPTVFHRVATVSGRLRPDRGPIDLLRAALPAGSITGAPKIRAMQIIYELETVQRGVYCGAIGYIGLDGRLCFNVGIRTMVLEGGTVQVHAGGGIVADSDAEEEYEEMLAKAEGMFRALKSVARLTASASRSTTARDGNDSESRCA